MRNIAVVAAAFALSAVCGLCGTVVWTGESGDGLWYTPGNWSGGSVPNLSGSGDDVLIEDGDVCYVPGGDFIAYTAVTIGPGGSWRQDGGEAWPFLYGRLVVDGGSFDSGSAGRFRMGSGGSFSVINGGNAVIRPAFHIYEGAGAVLADGGRIEFGGAVYAEVLFDGFVFRNGAEVNFTNAVSSSVAAGVPFSVESGAKVRWSPSFPQDLKFSISGDSSMLDADGNFMAGNTTYMNGGVLSMSGEFMIKGMPIIEGTEVKCDIISIQAADASLTLRSGSVTAEGTRFDGLYCAGSSYINFVSGSTAELFFSGIAPEDVFSTYFAGDAPRIRYRGMTVSEEEFPVLFSVEEAADISGSSVKLAHESGMAELGGFGVYNISSSGADFSVSVIDGGAAQGKVYVCYGENDAGDDFDGWASRKEMGDARTGSILSSHAELEPETIYHFVFAVSNETGIAVFEPSPGSFASYDNLNIFTGAVSSDAADPDNWTLGKVEENHVVFFSSDCARTGMKWGSDMTERVAGWIQPSGFVPADMSVSFDLTPEAPLTITGDCFLFGGYWTHTGPSETPSNAVAVVVSGDMTVGADAQINAGNGAINVESGRPRGYRLAGPGYIPAEEVTGENGTVSHSGFGASHAGEGSAAGGVTYGSVVNPMSYGSSGQGDSADVYSGGGLIVLRVGGMLTVDGVIASDGFGFNSTVSCYGASSGGTVNIAAGRLEGVGTIRAEGGECLSGYSGSGGRILVSLTSQGAVPDEFGGVISAAGRDGVYGSAAGTVALRVAGNALTDVVVDNQDFADAQDGSAMCTHLPPMQDTDSPSVLAGTRWILRGHAAVRLTRDTIVDTLSMESASARIFTDGHKLTVRHLLSDGMEMPGGDYSGGEFPGIIAGDGVISVMWSPTLVLFK